MANGVEQGAAPSAPQQGAGQAAAGSEGNQAEQLITNVMDGLTMLQDVFGSLSPELGQEFASLGEQYKSLVQKAMSGGGAQPAAQAQGMTSPEVGAANASPVSPAGVPR